MPFLMIASVGFCSSNRVVNLVTSSALIAFVIPANATWLVGSPSWYRNRANSSLASARISWLSKFWKFDITAARRRRKLSDVRVGRLASASEVP